jgi:hypothetical protein
VYGTSRTGSARPIRNANSTSATRIELPSSGTTAPGASTRSRSMRPAIGPSTLMCRWPATLVAAIFQPTTGWPERSASEACTA